MANPDQNRTRFLSISETRTLMRVAKDYHAGKIPLPPEIVALKRKIAAKTRNAELFIARTGAVDNGMVFEIVDMRMRLDSLYGAWVRGENRGVIA